MKKRTYSEMKDSGVEWIGEIPKGWEIFEIEDLYSIRNIKVNDEDYPPLSVTMKGILPQLKTVAKSDDHSNRKLVRKSDFVINSRSDRKGACGISQYEGSVSLINIVLEPIRRTYEQYYNLVFHTAQFSDEFYKWGHGIVGDLWTTSWQDMKKISVIFPPLSEQTAIANYLDVKCAQLNEIISEIQKSIEEYKKWKSSIIFEAVTKGLAPNVEMKDSGVEWIGEIPKGWEIRKLKHLSSIVMGQSPDSDEILDAGKYHFMQGCSEFGEVYPNTMKFCNKPKKISCIDDILMSVRAPVGKVNISDKNYGIGRGLCAIRAEKMDRNFLWYSILKSESDFCFYSNGSTFDAITVFDLSNFNIPLPPPSEQTAIADYLDNKCAQIDEIISEKEALIPDLESYKKSLIYEVVTGKIRVS